MENIVTLLIPVLLGIALIRMLLLPLKLMVKLLLHSAGGFLCLWLLNMVSGLTGISLPVNLITIFIAGFLGIPGIGIIAFLEFIAR
jgi:inhibitor of the pro-sigma K processing machinery